MMFKSFSQNDWFLLRMRIICHHAISFWIQTWSPKSVHGLPFLVPKIILFCWLFKLLVVGVSTIIFFPRTSLQLCIVCHGTSCIRWKIRCTFYCFHAILISVSVDLKIHQKKIRQKYCGFSLLKNILVDVSLSKSELISFSKKGMIYAPNSVLEITHPLFESFIFGRLKIFPKISWIDWNLSKII